MYSTKTKLTIKQTLEYNDLKNDDYEYTKDISDANATEMIEEYVKIMKFLGYAEVSIWRAMEYQIEQLKESFEYIENTRDEWKEEL